MPTTDCLTTSLPYNDKLQYRGYIGRVVYDGDANLFVGEVINTQAVITFKGSTVNQLKKSFIDSIVAYLEFCKELGEDPEEPPQRIYSGKFSIRISPDLHRFASERARLLDLSLNEFVTVALEKQVVNIE